MISIPYLKALKCTVVNRYLSIAILAGGTLVITLIVPLITEKIEINVLIVLRRDLYLDNLVNLKFLIRSSLIFSKIRDLFNIFWISVQKRFINFFLFALRDFFRNSCLTLFYTTLYKYSTLHIINSNINLYCTE